MLLLTITRQARNVRKPTYVHIARMGKRGRPRKVPDRNYLRQALAPGSHIKVTDLADSLGMHRNTLSSYLNENNISHGYSTISNNVLDDIVREYRRANPHAGLRYLSGHLRTLGHKVQQRRVQESVKRVDPLGQILRERNPIRRGKYKVSRPNALWHLDGHHKLIRWGIVIHGIVDGYSRTVSSSSVYAMPASSESNPNT